LQCLAGTSADTHTIGYDQHFARFPMRLTALGVNHMSAPLAVRERLALPVGEQSAVLSGLRALPGVEGAMVLSTCNRTELYLASAIEGSHASFSQDALSWYLKGRTDAANLSNFFYRHEGIDAVRHVFRVATGLDSMVLGEPQILGQLKSAYADAKAANTLAPALERLLQQSFFVAKQARTDTGLGQNPVSVASSAVRLAKQIYDDFERRTALIIGAGETASLIARHLRAQGLHRLLITNRTFARAQALAEELDGQAVLYTQLERHLADADLVVTATASTQPLLHVAQIQAVQKGRKRRTLLLIDLSVPRNIEAAAADLRDVFLYGVDDLRHVAEIGQNARQQAAVVAEAAINGHAQEFMSWLRAREKFEPILALRERSFAQRDLALMEAKKRLAAGANPTDVIEKLAHQLTNQLLHAPTSALRDAAAAGDDALLQSARQILRLDR
jgi:glutamyl-tRNA reductase